MTPIRKITVQDVEISISQQNNSKDYICLSDIVKGQEGDDYIRNWMRNRNTLDYLGTWEMLNNPHFKGVEFDTFLYQAGSNRFNMTPRKWVETTNAIGIVSKSGRNGGTYAHKDIAFEFCSWLSPVFKLYLVKEYQRLKDFENNQYQLEWNVKRILSKANYSIHTDAVKNYIIPTLSLEKQQEALVYAEEADILNLALWGCTAKQWREANNNLNTKKLNIRDVASINELAILSNLENLNAEWIKENLSKKERFQKLRTLADYQRNLLNQKNLLKGLKKEELVSTIRRQISEKSKK